MKCPKCDGTGEMQICEMGFIGKDECDKCHGKGYLTNEEYLRSCTTEQLAEALLNIMANNEFTLYLLHTEKKSVQEMKDAVVEWLKQPHTSLKNDEK